MKHLQLIFWGLTSVCLLSEAIGEKHLSSDSSKRDIYQGRDKFKCPFPFGAFADPEDCQHFYVCVAGFAARKKCSMFLNFDILRRRCMPKIVAICGNDKDKGTTTASPVTATENDFKCPKFMGSFPHPTDCSKYYNCIIYVPNLKTCPEKQLFDTAKSSCKPENEVDCGTRQRPGYTTIAISTEPEATEISETISTEDITESNTEIINTEEDKTESITEIISTEEDITESTTEVTTKLKPTGPPDHNCDEDDVDCIITETGDADDWFICPRAIGAFPHPSSDKLFIFCMNWIPSVKKCGQELVFSKERSTCIAAAYFVQFAF